uniref:Secreted protein n=1 Tax=Haemonchus contortus TaxID=6289 RepID=A0A7I4Y9F2_HAECO
MTLMLIELGFLQCKVVLRIGTGLLLTQALLLATADGVVAVFKQDIEFTLRLPTENDLIEKFRARLCLTSFGIHIWSGPPSHYSKRPHISSSNGSRNFCMSVVFFKENNLANDL